MTESFTGLLEMVTSHAYQTRVVLQTRGMSYLPDDLYASMERSMPISCVDFVPVRTASDGTLQVGLILRESPFGNVWCHLGGRVRHGETIAQALQRHAEDTLSTRLQLPDDPQPTWVYQWFPPDLAPDADWPYGTDPRKHSIALSFTATLDGAPQPRNEALDFAYHPIDDLPELLWPGCRELLAKLTAPLNASATA
jgi:ADP-ribose pyrophosphatase YjhB (NUDIX family)